MQIALTPQHWQAEGLETFDLYLCIAVLEHMPDVALPAGDPRDKPMTSMQLPISCTAVQDAQDPPAFVSA